MGVKGSKGNKELFFLGFLFQGSPLGLSYTQFSQIYGREYGKGKELEKSHLSTLCVVE